MFTKTLTRFFAANIGHSIKVVPRRLRQTLAAPKPLDVAVRPVMVDWLQNHGRARLETSWSDLKRRSFPYVWLRDNCQCSKCFDASSKSRTFLLKDLDVKIKPTGVKLNPGGKQVTVQWTDGHESCYDNEWLKQRGFNDEDKAELNEFFEIQAQPWGSEHKDNIPRISFEALMNDDRTLYEWLHELESRGLVFLQGAPTEEGQLKRIGERIAFLKKTNYGETFAAKVKMNPSNLTYTSNTLGLHTDLPYWDYTPGVQMLHCIKQTTTPGGGNEFADGFKVALHMKKVFPKEYELLSTIPVDYFDIGVDFLEFHMISRRPIIQENADGDVIKINFNQQTRDSFFPQEVDLVQKWYSAYKLFNDLLYHKDNYITYKMADGEVACFHNFRVLHGRLGFGMTTEASERHLEGAFLDWDELRSRRRVLQAKLNM